jgi:hypothetical protein
LVAAVTSQTDDEQHLAPAQPRPSPCDGAVMMVPENLIAFVDEVK